MSKERLDYSILCPNYYTNWEEGCCMETCTHNDLDLCPIHYVKGLLEDKDQQIKILQKALELACDTAQFEDTCDYCAYQGELEITKQCPCFCETDEKFFKTQTFGYFIEKAKEMIKSE